MVADREPSNHAFGPASHSGCNNVNDREWVAREPTHAPLRGMYL